MPLWVGLGCRASFYLSLLDPMQNERAASWLGTKMKKVVLVSLAVSVAFNLLVVWMLW
jgi:S-ribosylhomocysteine lyase LuxS involved in autoinducer biosynthesis